MISLDEQPWSYQRVLPSVLINTTRFTCVALTVVCLKPSWLNEYKLRREKLRTAAVTIKGRRLHCRRSAPRLLHHVITWELESVGPVTVSLQCAQRQPAWWREEGRVITNLRCHHSILCGAACPLQRCVSAGRCLQKAGE